MYLPYLSKRAPYPKGGGGGGHGSWKGSSSGAKGGKGSASSSKSSIPLLGTPFSASLKGKGGGKPVVISPGYPFAGRSVGGGSRDEVFGDRQYGSGYPGSPVAGIKGRDFPFGFWPVVLVALLAVPAYLDAFSVSEYGLPENADRPGGPMTIASFSSKASQNGICYLISDQATVVALIPEVNANCSALVAPSNLAPIAFTVNNQSHPLPEQAIQYYRSSSAVLMLDGYNNSAVFSSANASNSPLPENIDAKLLECLNSTIGAAIPIANSAPPTLTLLLIFNRIVPVTIFVMCSYML